MAGKPLRRKPGSAPGDRGVANVKEKLQKSVEAGDYYEAHQMYRTVYFRLMGQKKYGDALELLMAGAEALFKAGQSASAADLALLVLELYSQSHTAVNDESRERVRRLFQLFPASEPLRERFVAHALRWSKDEGPNTRGDPQLRHVFGMAFYKEKEYEAGRRHLMLGTDLSAKALADMLVQWDLEAGNTPRDHWLALTVLQLLLLGDLKHANIVFERFVAKHPSIGTLPDQTLPQSAGLVNFLWHLLPLCQYDAAPVFVTLRRMVKPDDASFSEMIDKVGEMYFRVRPERPAGLNIMDMMRSIMGGMDGDF